MEWMLINGDYVPDGSRGVKRLEGSEAVLQRALFRLCARRGALPFLPRLGSRLHLVLREKPSARQALAAQFVAEALEDESDLTVSQVTLGPCVDGQAQLTVALAWGGNNLRADLTLEEGGDSYADH